MGFAMGIYVGFGVVLFMHVARAAVATKRRGTSRRAGAARDAKRRDRDARRDDPKFAAASATRGGANARGARDARAIDPRGVRRARNISARDGRVCLERRERTDANDRGGVEDAVGDVERVDGRRGGRGRGG